MFLKYKNGLDPHSHMQLAYKDIIDALAFMLFYCNLQYCNPLKTGLPLRRKTQRENERSCVNSCTSPPTAGGQRETTASLMRQLSNPSNPLHMRTLNPFLFIRGPSCPRSVQTSLISNCLNYIPVPYNLLPVL
jgi:hypothetical protein